MEAGLPGDVTVDVVVADWPGSETPVVTARWDDDDLTVTVTSNLPLDEALGAPRTVRRATQDDWSAADAALAEARAAEPDDSDADQSFVEVRVRTPAVLAEGQLSDGRTWTAEIVPPGEVSVDLDGGGGPQFWLFLAPGVADAIRIESTADMTAVLALIEPDSTAVRMVAWVGGIAGRRGDAGRSGHDRPDQLDRREARCAGVRPDRAVRRATDGRRGVRGRSDRLDRSPAVSRGRSSGADEIEFLAPR